MKRFLPVVAVLALSSRLCSAQAFNHQYLDRAPPDTIPRSFPLETPSGFTPSDRIAISPDGTEIFYSEVASNWSRCNIRYYAYSDGRWNGPFDLEGFLGPAFSPDGNRLFFEKYGDSMSCWESQRIVGGWNTPVPCPLFPNTRDKHYVQMTDSGNIYASSSASEGGLGRMDIAVLLSSDDGGVFRSLGSPLNSTGNEGDFYIARDESFIVFASPHRGGNGGADLYLSFRTGSTWSEPENLGTTVNTAAYEFGPFVTSDTNYLFYSSTTDFNTVGIFWIRFDTILNEMQK